MAAGGRLGGSRSEGDLTPSPRRSVGDAASAGNLTPTRRHRRGAGGGRSVTADELRPRSAVLLDRRTVVPLRHSAVRLVETRSGWQPTVFRDTRSAFNIVRMAKADDAAREERRLSAQRRLDDSRRSGARPSSAAASPVTAASFAKVPGRTSQSRAPKSRLKWELRNDQRRPLRNKSNRVPAFPEQSRAFSTNCASESDDLERRVVEKGDEVVVETPGGTRVGFVRGCWKPARVTALGEPAKPEQLMVKFEIGGGWFDRELCDFKSRPDEPLELSLLLKMRDDPLIQAQLASKPQGGALITDLIAGKGGSPASRREQAAPWKKAKEGESVVSEITKQMFKLLVAERLDELQGLVDDGADVAARNALGQTMYEVASEKQKWLSGATPTC